MTSRIIVAIVAIVAAVLSLAAPVAVDAQTPTLTVAVNTIGGVSIEHSGFSNGWYRSLECRSASALPASCACPAGGAGLTLEVSPTSGNSVGAYGLITRSEIAAPYVRQEAYAQSDATCTTALASVTYQRSTMLPTWRVRDVTNDSATIYIEEAFSTHGVTHWRVVLNPSDDTSGITEVEAPIFPTEAPTHTLTGLSAGTTYTYGVCGADFGDTPCEIESTSIATVTFTTLGSLPGPAPPTGVEVTATTDATTDGSGSVTLSWSNPGDPDIASYEYYLRRSGGRGEWRTVAGSNADTTSVTIDLTTGEAVAGNARGVTPTIEWTVYLRTRGVNGGSSRAIEITFTTLGSASEPEPPEETPETPGSVPALPLAGLVTLAVVLFLGGAARRKGLQP